MWPRWLPAADGANPFTHRAHWGQEWAECGAEVVQAPTGHPMTQRPHCSACRNATAVPTGGVDGG